MNNSDWHPGKLLELSGIYWQTCTLHAGVKLEVFTCLGDQALAAEAVAASIGADRRATAMLLNALTAMTLLEKDGRVFRNSPAARSFLVKTAPGYLGHMILHHHNLMESWARLDQGILSGRPLRVQMDASGDETRRENFLMGMFNNSMLLAPRIVDLIDLSDRRQLLDLGGGPGTYAIQFCLKNPHLKATVFDLVTTRPFAQETIARFGVADRVEFEGGDYHVDRVKGVYDVVWISHILHAEGPDDCRKIVAKAAAALSPGGRIFIHDFFLDDSMAAPRFPALFALNMLLGTESGQSYSATQVTEMLAGCGVEQIERLDFVGPTESGIITGTV
jgi:predicted O-methyltransferase YrrM